MKPHDWHTLGAFGLLTVALAIFDKKMALWAIGAASAVVIVKNSGFVVSALGGGKKTA